MTLIPFSLPRALVLAEKPGEIVPIRTSTLECVSVTWASGGTWQQQIIFSMLRIRNWEADASTDALYDDGKQLS